MDETEQTASRDNSLRIDLCINTTVKQDGNLAAVFITDVDKWSDIIKSYEKELSKICHIKAELTKEEIDQEKARILNANREHAQKSEHQKRNNQQKQAEQLNKVWENSTRKPNSVAIGGPDLIDSRKRKGNDLNYLKTASKSSR